MKNIKQILLVIILSVSFVAVAAYATTTTIGSDILTTGTLGVSGLSTLANATTTMISTTGSLWVGGYATTTGSNGNFATLGIVAASSTLQVTGATTLYSTLGVTGLTTLVNASTTLLTNSGIASTTSLVVGGDATSGTVSGIVFGTCTFNPGAITASSTVTSLCASATGVRTTDKVFVTPRSLENYLVMTSASSTVNGSIQVSVYNAGWGGAITPASATWNWMAIR